MPEHGNDRDSGEDAQTDTRVGHHNRDDTDHYVGRGPNGRDMLSAINPWVSGWLGNPYTLDDYDRADSITRFRRAFEDKLCRDAEFRDAVASLAGDTLGCWCQRLGDDSPACHGEVIAEWADRLASEGEAALEDAQRVMADGGRDTPDRDERVRTSPTNGDGLTLTNGSEFCGPLRPDPRPSCAVIACGNEARYCSDHRETITGSPTQDLLDTDDDTAPSEIVVCLECLGYWPNASKAWDHCPACGEPALETAVREAGESV